MVVRLAFASCCALLRSLALLVVTTAMLCAVPAAGQSNEQSTYSQDELDQLLAPIALYPDELLSQVLIASTYPLEVVEAARFVQQNAQLTGDALDDALAARNWDPSVQSLAAFPQVLTMMSDKLEWTERLGNAFLADEQRVMDTVQALRRKAQASGNLASTPQQSVTDQDNEIVIEPTQPDVVYVPVYDPLVVYGPWWAPAYPPWFWYPPYYYFGYPVIIAGIVYGYPCPIHHDHWGWSRPDWHGHHVIIDPTDNRFWHRPNRPAPPPSQPWQHSQFHRRGVPYPDAHTRERYLPVNPNDVRGRQVFRGYPSAPAPRVPEAPRPTLPSTGGELRAVPSPTRPGTTPYTVTPPAPYSSRSSVFDPGVSREQSRINAQRGAQSRQSMPSPAPVTRSPAPAAPAVRAPAAAPAPATRAPAPGPAPSGGRR